MKDLIEFIAKSLVDNPGDVDVREVDNAHSLIIELRVNKSDMGKVIGKQGRIVKAIRSVLKAAAQNSEKPVYLEVI